MKFGDGRHYLFALFNCLGCTDDIVGKKRDLGKLDPMIFSGKIRKNTPKIQKNTEKSGKYSENLEKYVKFGQILW